jgi:hypothetical protein
MLPQARGTADCSACDPRRQRARSPRMTSELCCRVAVQPKPSHFVLGQGSRVAEQKSRLGPPASPTLFATRLSLWLVYDSLPPMRYASKALSAVLSTQQYSVLHTSFGASYELLNLVWSPTSRQPSGTGLQVYRTPHTYSVLCTLK